MQPLKLHYGVLVGKTLTRTKKVISECFLADPATFLALDGDLIFLYIHFWVCFENYLINIVNKQMLTYATAEGHFIKSKVS